MLPLVSDAQFNSIALVVIAAIGIIPGTLAVVYSRKASNNAVEAKENSAGALHEVKANGGMSDPDPTLKDYIKFVGESVVNQDTRLSALENLLEEHLAHSKIMDSALAQVFLHIRPDMDRSDAEELQERLT